MDPELGGWHQAFQDPQNNGGKTPDAIAASKVDENPQDFRDLSMNINGLAYLTQKPSSDVGLNYEQEKQQFVKNQGWDMPSTESQFRGQLAGYVENKFNKHQALDELYSDTVLKALADTDHGAHRGVAELPTDLASVWNQKHAPLIPDQKERDAYHEQARSLYLETMKQVAPIRNEVATSLKVLNGFTTGKTDQASVDQLATMYKDMAPEQVDKILSFVSVAAKREHLDKKQTKGFLQNLGESIARGADFAGDFLNNGELTNLDLLDKQIKAGNHIYVTKAGEVKVGDVMPVTPNAMLEGQQVQEQAGIPATPEQVASLKAQVEDKIKAAKVSMKLKAFAQSDIDPITPITKAGTWARTFEQMSYDVGSSLAPMGATALSPVAGFEAYRTMHLNDLVLKNPDADLQHLNTIAAVEGSLEAVGDMLEINVIKGVMPKLIDNYVKKFGSKVVRALLRAAEAVGFEYVIETGQDAIPAAIEGTANAIGDDINQTGSWNDFNVFDARRFWAIAFMGGVGAGVATFRDLKDPRRQFNRTMMGYNGIHGAQAEYVLASESPDEADTRFKEVYAERTEEDIARGTELLVQDSIKAQEKNGTSDTYTAVRNAAGQAEFVVSDPAGKEIGRFADEEAARNLISDRVKAKLVNEENTVNDLLDWWKQQDPNNTATIEAPKTVQQELDRMQGVGDTAGIANLHERIAFAIESGDIKADSDLNTVNILGGAKLETTAEGVFRGVISLAENAKPEDAFEEINHVFVKRALAEGRVTMPQLQSWLAQTEAATGTKYARETETDVMENIAKIGMDYAAGRINESVMPQSFVDYVKKLLLVLKESMLRALKLKDAFSEGKIDQNFESFLAESVGLDPQIMFEKESDRVAAEIAGDNTAYSLGKGVEYAQQNAELAKKVMQQARALAKAGEDAEGHFFSEFWAKMVAKGGMNFKPTTENILKAVKKGLPDVLEWLKKNPQYQNYYHKDWELTHSLLKQAFPDITDDEFVGFRIITGLCSPSTKLAGNMKDAVQLMRLWKETGSLKSMEWEWSPKGNRKVKDGNPFKLEGTTGALKIFSLHAIDSLFNKLGSWQKVHDYLHEAVTTKELNAFNREIGFKGDVGDIGKIRKVVMEATGQDELIPRMFAFGSKVGAYTLNTTGDDRFTTTDIWEARFVRSHFPEMFASGTGLPVNMDEHQLFQNFSRVFGEQFKASTGLDLPPSALQAIRWFYMIESAKNAGYAHAKTDQSISGYTEAAIRAKIGNISGLDSRSGGQSNGASEEGNVATGEQSYSIRDGSREGIGININDGEQDFTDQILRGEKTIETRNTRSLDPYIGKRVGLVRTGKGKAQHVGFAVIGEPKFYSDAESFRQDEDKHLVPVGSEYDIPETGKWGYPIINPEKIQPRDVLGNGIVGRKVAFSLREGSKAAEFLKEYEGWESVATTARGRKYSPIIQDLLRRREAGESIPQEVFNEAANMHFPAQLVVPPKSLKELPTQAQVKKAIGKKYSDEMPAESDSVTIRQDVPSFTDHGIGVVTIKSAAGLAYRAFARILTPQFITNEKATLKIGLGGDKGPHIAIKGEWSEDQSLPDDLENWTQVGFNPDRHSYYYDRSDMRQVTGGSEAFQIGNTVFVKDAVFGDGRISDISYSIRSQENIDSVTAAMQTSQLFTEPHLSMYERAKQRFTSVLEKNRDTLLGMEASGASSQAIRNEKLKQALIELDGILKTLPYEVRGRVGGMSVLANIGTGDKALADFFKKRVEMLDKELERYLGKEYDEATYKFLQTTLPKKREAGEKPKGIGADLMSMFAVVREAQKWNDDEVNAHLAKIDHLIDSGTLSAEEEAKLTREGDLVSAIGNWKDKTSDAKRQALLMMKSTWSKGYQKFLTDKVVEKQERDAAQSKAIANTGKNGLLSQRQEEDKKQQGVGGNFKKGYFNLIGWDHFVSILFGENSETAKFLANGEREASNTKEDRTQAKLDEVSDLFTKLAGSRLAGEELRYNMAQKTIKPFTGTPWSGLEFSQMEALSATMLWMQEDGRRHMEGKLDENGQPISAWHYNQKFVDMLEDSLSPEAKALRAFLLDKYAKGYHDINKVYSELNRVSLPQIANYSPVTVAPVTAPAGSAIDPVTGSVTAARGSSPSALRTRGTSYSEPKFQDVLQTYLAHTRQMEHWMAYAPFMKEANGILRNRDVQNAIHAKGGEEAKRVLNLHLDIMNQGGVRDAATQLGLNAALSKIGGRAAQIALVGRLSTIVLQSTQLGASLAEMPTGAYILRLSKLLSGNLGWGEALKSDYIQRRLKEMPPIVRQAMEGLHADKPNKLKHAVESLGRLISGADALFTAGTYAMVYDYHFTQAKSMGIPSPEEYAHGVAERATDKLAQPTRMGARSVFENTQTGPLARAGWAFASEARKNIGLAAYALTERPAAVKVRTLVSLLVLNSMVGTIIRNAWRDAKDSDDKEVFDEKHWNIKRLFLNWGTDWLQGIPLLGDAVKGAAFKASGEYLPQGNLFSIDGAMSPLTHIPKYMDGKADWEMAIKDLDHLVSGIGMLNGTMSAAASLTHLATDLFGAGKNAVKASE